MTANFHRILLAGLLTASSAACVQAADEARLDPDKQAFFEKHIRPVLLNSCYKCHSAAEKVKGGLAVDTKEALLTGGDSGPAVVPGRPDKSLLLKAIRYEDKDLQMPPKGEKLSDAQIADFEMWIRMGAPDPRMSAAPKSMAPISMEKGKNHWAFQPIANPVPPKVADPKHWIQSPIDAFVLAKLLEKKLEPTPRADKRTLIRRVAYDLTGLPPTPEEVEDFEADHSPDAFAKVIDHYLESPHYGERWGRYWLDVARYADTTGDRQNRGEPRYPFAWTYRDYVINAFNKDLPYDKFIMQQIAADKLPQEDDKHSLAALGFLTVGKRFMGNMNDVIDDRIDVVTQGFMALTVSCARCHDHKFDPIPTKDYYSLYGIFLNSPEPERGPFLEQPKATPEYQEFIQKYTALEKEVNSVRDREYDKAMTDVHRGSGDYLLASYLASKMQKVAEQRAMLREKGLNFNVFQVWEAGMKKLANQSSPVMSPWFAYAALPEKDFAEQAKAVTEKLSGDKSVNALVAEALAKAQPTSMKQVADVYSKLFVDADKAWKALQDDSKETPLCLADQNQEAVRLVMYSPKSPVYVSEREARNLIGGAQIANIQGKVYAQIYKLETEHPGSPARAMIVQDADRIKPARVLIRGETGRFGDTVPRQFLEILAGPNRKPFTDGSGRLELAKAIASRDNPLTARVIVNRVWAHYFGSGLVKTPGDFGLRAEAPTHPELLDHLATYFMDHGWSFKSLHRYILLSGVYQQGSLDNPKYAEIDPGNQYLWRMNLRRLDFESLRDTLLAVGGNIDLGLGGKPVEITESPAPTRRTVYGMVDRFVLPELYRVFDFANPDMTSAQRMMTTVPQQALFMMNSPFVIEQARQLVQRTDFQAKQTDEEKIKFIYETLFQRTPTSMELSMAKDYVASHRALHGAGEDTGADGAAWSYGIATYNAGKPERFREFTSFVKNSYQFGEKTVAKIGNASLTAFGGTAASRDRIGVVRRWTAPQDGVISISGELIHDSDKGDGVQGRIFSSRTGELGKWDVFHNHQETMVQEIEVKQGDTIDFVVDCRNNSDNDQFIWSPKVKMNGGAEWDARAQFTRPVARQGRDKHPALNSWEKFTQVMFLTNEMVFLN